MMITVPVAWLILLPDDLENYGQSLVATTLSANNILLFLTQNYFSAEAEFKPLIHTWSLGVEEQYYAVVPLLMILLFSVGRRKGVVAGVAVITAASFVACLVLQRRAPNANFYLIFSRAWEMGVGALTAMLESRLRLNKPRAEAVLAALALPLLVAPLFLFDGQLLLPGAWTLAPVLGAALALLYARPDNGVGRLLGSRLLVGIGLLSYSAYLYHQPLFAFVRLSRLSEPPAWLLLSLVPVVFVLAYLSWRFVERPFRNAERVSTPMMLYFVASVSIALGGIGLVLYATSGFYSQWSELSHNDPDFGPAQNSSYNMRPFIYAGKRFSTEDHKRILVLGNSFARDFINMGDAVDAFRGKELSYVEIDECAALPPIAVTNSRGADLVVLGSGVSAGYLPCFQRLVAQLRRTSPARVVVLGTKGFGWNNNAVMLLPRRLRYGYHALPLAELTHDDKLAKLAFSPDVYLSIFDLIIDDKGKVPVFTSDYKFISQDRKHLTPSGARFIGNKVFRHPLLASFFVSEQSAIIRR
jgi:peptidoglycan/LPS O-acetylase OafA/YrhL